MNEIQRNTYRCMRASRCLAKMRAKLAVGDGKSASFWAYWARKWAGT